MSEATQPNVLARKRAAARAALWFEQVWPAAWPAIGVLGAYVCLALLDVPALLPPWPRLILAACALLAMALLLWRGFSGMVRPSAATADRRLEIASGLRHRPLATLGDRPAGANPEQEAVWQIHLARLAAQIPRLRVGRPRPGLAGRDSWALRGGLLVALSACLVIAGPETVPRLGRAFTPTLPDGPPAPGTEVQAWLTPPAYTGLPPIILHPATPDVSAPAGSHLTASVTGGSGEPELAINGEAQPFHRLDKTSWQTEREMEGSAGGTGRVTILRHGGTIAAWSVRLIPDQPPTVAFTEAPGANMVAGRPTLQTRLSWQATDDYGVVSVAGELRLRDRPDAPPLLLPAPLAGSPKTAKGAIVQDLTAHPWAGLPVLGRMTAKDAPGQVGTSPEAGFTLPERTFQHPIARALIAVRRQLSLTPDERRPARMMIDAIADQPDSFDNSIGIMLNLRAIGSLLASGRGQAAVDEAQARMWELALALEEGGPDRTARALEQARQALRDALDPNRTEPADRAEIERRMQELRDAIQKHIEALAEQARREGTEMPQLDPNQPQLTARDLDRMAEKLQQALRDRRMDDARQQMAELEKLLQELQNARPEHGEQREQRNAERRQRGRQQMDAVQDMVQREGQLLDRSQTRGEQQDAQTSPSPRQPQQGRQSQGQSQPNEQRGGDAKAQQAMRRALGELMQRFGDLTGQVPQPLGEADQAMRDAAQALAEGKESAAGAAEKRAIEALQKGGREMGQQIARQFGVGQQEGEGDDGQDQADGNGGQNYNDTQNRDGATSGARPGDESQPGRRRSARRDPLGRPLQEGTSGADESGDVRVPDEMEQARTREIQEELRRRGAERTRPQGELDYIDRLLKPF
ncbi:MAG: DUF4175 family protein [Acetobacteraceae bacterium]|nr:DUF4175 family protein [Acetobacteraceae bacterium]